MRRRLGLFAGISGFVMAFTVSGCGTSNSENENANLLTVRGSGEEQITIYMEEVQTPAEVVKKLKQNQPGGPVTTPPTTPEIPGSGGEDVFVLLDKIINTGKKIWSIIDNNKAVADIKYDYANAIPEGIKNWEEMDGFSDLQHKSYRYYAKNLYGITVFDVVFTLVHQYGGTYKGKGKYLINVSVIPSRVDVKWAWHVDMSVRNLTTSNVGTREAPIASALLELTIRDYTAIQDDTMVKVFQFRGDKATPVVATY